MMSAKGVLAAIVATCLASSWACKDATSNPPATSASLATSPPSPATAEPEPACDLGVWDAAAKACAIPPQGATGYPGAWAGCSSASEPQNSRCFTGTHWAKCECACNGTTKWSDEKRRCE
jgi:hypothetical protein